MLHVVCKNCRVTPQLHESADGLPRLKLSLHSCSLATNTVKFTSLLVIVKGEDFKDDILNSTMQSLGYEMDDEVLFYYKIPLKSLDISLKPLVSESDYRSFQGYVQKHKVMHVYVELIEKDEEHESDSDSNSDSESENEIVDEEHVVDEVEVNMNNFKFQIDEEDESSGNDAIVPNVNVTEDNLEVLDFDSLESDLEDVPKNARSLGLRKLKKKHLFSKFFIGREFANKDLAKDLIRDHVVESRRNLHFLKNNKRRIRVLLT
nr:transposase, mutator type [Tanacetum cinerariifolium]